MVLGHCVHHSQRNVLRRHHIRQYHMISGPPGPPFLSPVSRLPGCPIAGLRTRSAPRQTAHAVRPPARLSRSETFLVGAAVKVRASPIAGVPEDVTTHRPPANPPPPGTPPADDFRHIVRLAGGRVSALGHFAYSCCGFPIRQDSGQRAESLVLSYLPSDSIQVTPRPLSGLGPAH